MSKTVRLSTAEQREAWQQLRTAVAADTDKPYLTDGEVLRAAALAYLGRDGWRSVGKVDGRGRSTPTQQLEPGGDLAPD